MQDHIIFVADVSLPSPGPAIYTVAPDGSNLTELTAAGTGWFYAVAPRNMSKILGMKDVGPIRTLFLMEPDGSGATAITNIHPLTATNVAPTFSPDGKQIVLPYSSTPVFYNPAGATIVNVDNSGYTLVPLSTINSGNGNTVIYWSPDGDRIAFPENNAESGLGVGTCKIDGSDLIHVMHSNDFWYDVFGWYADNETLLIGAMSTRSPFPMTVMKSTGAVLYTDATEARVGDAMMSPNPNGSQVVLYEVDGSLSMLDGGALTHLITPPPYPRGGINDLGGVYFLQWVDPPPPIIPSLQIGPGSHGHIRID